MRRRTTQQGSGRASGACSASAPAGQRKHTALRRSKGSGGRPVNGCGPTGLQQLARRSIANCLCFRAHAPAPLLSNAARAAASPACPRARRCSTRSRPILCPWPTRPASSWMSGRRRRPRPSSRTRTASRCMHSCCTASGGRRRRSASAARAARRSRRAARRAGAAAARRVRRAARRGSGVGAGASQVRVHQANFSAVPC